MQDPMALDARVRDAAATTPECGDARRELAGVALGRHSRPPTRPRDSSKRKGDACARVRGVKGAIVPRQRPASEGGGAAAPASS
jgi:hypothetical protein